MPISFPKEIYFVPNLGQDLVGHPVIVNFQ